MADIQVIETTVTTSTVIDQGTVGPQGPVGAQGVPGIDGSSGLFVVRVTESTEATPNSLLLADTSGTDSGSTYTLPLSPQTGWRVRVIDVGGAVATKPITIAGNGYDVAGYGETRTISEPYRGESFVFDGENDSWRLEEKVLFDGKMAAETHAARTDNPHGVTAAQSGAIPKSLLTAAGSMLTSSAAGTPVEFLAGAGGKTLRMVGGLPTWSDAPNPNLLIDGNFDYWFEGTSQTASGFGSDSMSRNEHVGCTKTHSRGVFAAGDTDGWDAPADYYSRTVVTSVSGAANYARKAWRLEGVTRFVGKKTFSFRGRAPSGAANVACEVRQNFGSGGSADVTGIGAQLVALTTSFEKKTVTVDVPSCVGKTIGAGSYLEIIIWYNAGSDFASRASNLGQQSGTFDIAQVKLELGSVATPFVAPDPQHELDRVNRYYEIGHFRMLSFASSAGGYVGRDYRYRVEKRAIPTFTATNIYNAGCTSRSVPSANTPSYFEAIADTTGTGGVDYSFDWKSDARI